MANERPIRRLPHALLAAFAFSIATLVSAAGAAEGHDHHAMSAPAATLPSTAPAGAEVTLSTSVEDNKKQLVATVKLNGKPVEGATVWFGAKRSFGEVTLGQDQTLDDGTAAIAFPSDLPGDATGQLLLIAKAISPASVAGARVDVKMSGGTIVAAHGEPFPRALWAPQAPWELIAVIGVLLAGAWGSYVFVVFQLLSIKKGAGS